MYFIECAFSSFHSGFEKDPEVSKFEISTFVPQETIMGDYVIAGQILFLPVNGNGQANITCGKSIICPFKLQKVI